MPWKTPLRCPRFSKLLGFVYIHSRDGIYHIEPNDAKFVFYCERCKCQHEIGMEGGYKG